MTGTDREDEVLREALRTYRRERGPTDDDAEALRQAVFSAPIPARASNRFELPSFGWWFAGVASAAAVAALVLLMIQEPPLPPTPQVEDKPRAVAPPPIPTLPPPAAVNVQVEVIASRGVDEAHLNEVTERVRAAGTKCPGADQVELSSNRFGAVDGLRVRRASAEVSRCFERELRDLNLPLTTGVRAGVGARGGWVRLKFVEANR